MERPSSEGAAADGPRDAAAPLRVGLVGPGRARNGTGPYLARWFRDAGQSLVACAGRDPERTRAAAAALGLDDAEVYSSVDAMLERAELDVVAIASPPAAHRAALRGALGVGVPGVYCEKPLVAPDELDGVAGLLDGFLARGTLLVEGCQWPEVLPVFDRFWPGLRSGPIGRIAMRLAPSGTGLDMVLDSLSHLLSVVQALLPVDATTDLVPGTDVHWGGRDAEAQDLAFMLAGPFDPVEVRFVLARGERQPRPAWVAIDGHRIDRRIRLADYAMAFTPGEGEEPATDAPVAWTARDLERAAAGEGPRLEPVDDPLGLLVYRFVDLFGRVHGRTSNPPQGKLARVESERIRQRSRLFARILSTW